MLFPSALAGGVLTESIRRRPYQVILLDEFEKAHREVTLIATSLQAILCAVRCLYFTEQR
jgi:hypothetical protein